MQAAKRGEAIGVRKMATGIEGFDQITGGGLPQNRTSLVVGGPGSGKTIFALQSLANGARKYGESGIFVAFEETAERVIANAASFGWNLPALRRKSLFFFDAQLPPATVKSGNFDLNGLLALLKSKIDEMSAKRIVFDGLDVLLALLNDPLLEREEIYRLHRWLSGMEITGIITMKAENSDLKLTDRFTFVQYMVDCAIHLRQYQSERVRVRGIRVSKYRGSSFSENECPLVIGKTGLDVGALDLRDATTPSTERLSTGILRLDTMMAGGYLRGTGNLITGVPGTAKTTLCGCFVSHACRRNERALYISFDEGGPEIVRNLRSIGIRLADHISSGLLKMHSAQSGEKGAEEHLVAIQSVIREHRPTCVVIDPLSAIIQGGGQSMAAGMAQRLIKLIKAQGITLVCTSVSNGPSAEAELTELGISTVADSWIHLSYVIRGGERNRALTIIKARGTNHSNQVRELVLSDNGVDLADVYAVGGEVLMGTARWERENAEQLENERRRAEAQRRRSELESALANDEHRMESFRREVDVRREELKALLLAEEARQRKFGEFKELLLAKRGVGESNIGKRTRR